MADSEIIVRLTGASEIIEPSLLAFAQQYGWRQKILIKDKLEDNPVSILEFTKDVIYKFIFESIAAWNVNLAQTEARTIVQEQIEELKKQATFSLEIK